MIRARAFTLVELLVVISIIALLIALLLPALGAMQTSARQAMCASNLGQMGVANTAYAADNDMYVMKMHERGTIYPFDIAKKDDRPNQPQVWSIQGIQPYIASFSGPTVALEGAGIAVCPEVDAELMNKFYAVRNRTFPFIEIQYGYFGGVDRVALTSEVRNGAEDHCVQSQPGGADRVWMTDILYTDGSDKNSTLGAWRFNHGRRGWAYNEYDWMPNETARTPPITGINRLMGDGAVNWKPDNAFDGLDKMIQGTYQGPYIGRRGGDSAFF
ncbi:MAG: type II secretion system protein [Phycisphaeraceae bacterium]